MDNEIAKLANSAFVGGKEALAALIKIAESRIDENPKLSAEAYREVAAAYKHQIFVMAAKMEEMQCKIENLERLETYVDNHKHLLEVKQIISGHAPVFTEFSQKLKNAPQLENLLTTFANYYPDAVSLIEQADVLSETEFWATSLDIFRPFAFSWVVSHFSVPPSDEESRKALSEVSHCFDPNRVTVLSDLVGLWPLLQSFEQKEH